MQNKWNQWSKQRVLFENLLIFTNFEKFELKKQFFFGQILKHLFTYLLNSILKKVSGKSQMST